MKLVEKVLQNIEDEWSVLWLHSNISEYYNHVMEIIEMREALFPMWKYNCEWQELSREISLLRCGLLCLQKNCCLKFESSDASM